MINNRKIITLCGSTRFKDQFIETQKKLTLEGNVVLSLCIFSHSEIGVILSEDTIKMLSDIQNCQIDMCDELFVINVGRYIGDSTREEIEYAVKSGKIIKYLIK